MGKDTGHDVWIYWCGPLVGAIFAGLLFRVMNPGEVAGCGGIGSCDDEAEQEDPEFTCGASVFRPVEYRKYIVELIGTFLVCFTYAVAFSKNNANATQFAPFAYGFMLLSQIYAGGAVS